MELRLANDEERKAVGNRNGSIGTEEDYKSSELLGKEDNPWDFGMDEKPFEITTTLTADDVKASYTIEEPKSIKIGRILVYICFVLHMVAILWVSTRESIDLYYEAKKLQGIMGLFIIVYIVDAILVNAVYKKKISLCFIAWLLPFLYPMKRNKHVDGHGGLGTFCTLGMVCVTVFLCTAILKATRQYGEIIQIANEDTRYEAAALMDQKTDSGVRIGDKLLDNFIFTGGIYAEQDNEKALVLNAYGEVTLENGVFVEYEGVIPTVPTQLGFIKGEDGKYTFEIVKLDDKELIGGDARSYWRTVIMQ